MFMSGQDFRESLRAYTPSVYVNGRKVKSVAGDAELAPGVNAIALTYDYALRPELAPLMRAQQHTSGREVNRLIHIARSSADLLIGAGALMTEANGLDLDRAHGVRDGGQNATLWLKAVPDSPLVVSRAFLHLFRGT